MPVSKSLNKETERKKMCNDLPITGRGAELSWKHVRLARRAPLYALVRRELTSRSSHPLVLLILILLGHHFISA